MLPQQLFCKASEIHLILNDEQTMLQATSADNPDTFSSIFDFCALPAQNSEEKLHKPEWMSGCTIFNTGPPLVDLFLCPVSKKEGEAKWWTHS